MSRRDKSNGFALLAALWIAAILALLTLGLTAQFGINTEATRTDLLRGKQDLLHAAGIRFAALNIASSRASVAASGTPSSRLTLTLDSGTLDIAIENESARLDLRYLAPDLLSDMLVAAGVSSTSAALLPQRMRLLAQQNKSVTYRLLRQWLQSSPGAYQRLIAQVSLHNGGATVHPQLASATVLKWLPNLATADRQRLLAERLLTARSQSARAQSAAAQSVRAGSTLQQTSAALVSTPVHHAMLDNRLSAYYRITVTTRIGDVQRVSNEVIKMTNAHGTLFDSVARL